jgi:hypothetical protein
MAVQEPLQTSMVVCCYRGKSRKSLAPQGLPGLLATAGPEAA